MRIEGSYTLGASPEPVWSLLHDPVTIRQALPGCDEFDQISSTDYIAALRIQHGPFKGRYHGQIQLLNDELRDRFAINIDGEGPEGAISGSGMVFLDEQEGSTILHYAGDVDFAGITAEESPRMIQTIANSLIRQFFESIDTQVRIQTGIHTTHLAEDDLRLHRTGTMDLEDEVAEIKQDRRTLWIVLALIAFTFFSFTGVGMILLLLVRWGKRIFDHRVTSAVQEHLEDSKAV